MNKEQQKLLDEAYENYMNNFTKPICPPNLDVQPDYYKPMTKEWFIKSVKENNSRGQAFSVKWGLKIEEQEILEQVDQNNPVLKGSTALCKQKLITVTYNNKTITSNDKQSF